MTGIPALVAERARALDLGEPRGAYRRPDSWVHAAIWAMLAGPLALVGLSGLATGDLLLLPGLFVAVAISWYAVQEVRHRCLYLYAGGALATGVTGRIRQAGRWEEIRLYYAPATTSTAHRYRLVFESDGGKVGFGVFRSYDHWGAADGIGPQVRIVSTQGKLPGALDRFRAGERLAFGPLTVDTAGLTHKAMALPWSDIREVVIYGETGHILIRRRSRGTISVRIGKIPDFSVLMKLVQLSVAPTGR